MKETFEQYLQRLKDRRTEDGYKYTDEDFENYIYYIFDCYEKGMSVYKCLEFMYFAERDMDDQLFNREPKQECTITKIMQMDAKMAYDSLPKQRLEKYSERFDNKDNELVEGVFNPDTWGKRLVDDVPKQELPIVNGSYGCTIETNKQEPLCTCVRPDYYCDCLLYDEKVKEEPKQDLRKYPLTPDECFKQETLEEITLEEVVGSKYCKYSVIENKLAIIYKNQEKILTAIKLIKNEK
jgi:hypothetical protein